VQIATAQSKQELIVVMVWLKFLLFFKPAALAVCILLSYFCSLRTLIWDSQVSFCTYEDTVFGLFRQEHKDLFWSSQVTNHEQCILSCAKSSSTAKNSQFHDTGVAKAPPVVQARWSDCMCCLFFFVSLFKELKAI
jgi:hypothetical protein